MQADTIKLIFTYAIALIIILGGGLALVITRNDPNPSDLQLVLAGFIGAAVQFVFNRETQTQTARSTQAAVAQGAGNGAPPIT